MAFPPFIHNKIEPYKASVNLTRYFEKNERLRETDRYAVVWYSEMSRNFKDNSQLLIKVVFFNIDVPNAYFQPELNVPFSAISKMPIGSIWKNGVCNSKFAMDEFEFTLGDGAEYDRSEDETDDLNEQIRSVYPAYRIMENKHSIIKVSNVGESNDTILIHPVLFFIAHFGYSMEIKRVLLTLDWGMENKTHYDHGDDFINKCLLNYRNNDHQHIDNLVYLPKRFVLRDSVLLHFLKVSDYARNNLRTLNKSIRTQTRNSPYRIYLEVKPWHEDYVQVLFEGTRLDDDTILCTRIKGISEPDFIEGDEINVVANPSFQNPVEGVEKEKDGFFHPVRKREKTEDIELNPDHPANNIETATIRESLKILGQKIAIKVHQQRMEGAQAGSKQALYSPEPSSYAAGHVSNSRGDVGYAGFCFEDVEAENSRDSRLQKLWEHAKALSGYRQNEKAEWFTYRLGFNSSDDFKLMSLRYMNKSSASYPKELIVIRLVVDGKLYYVLDSDEKTGTDTGMSGVVIIVDDEKRFLEADNNEGLLSIIISISSFPSGSLSKGFIRAFNGRLATFMHKTADKDDNNWISVAINKISKATYN